MGNKIRKALRQSTSTRQAGATVSERDINDVKKHVDHQLLVYGYMRQIEPNHKSPPEIARLCYRFYLIRKWILVQHGSSFHLLDATLPNLYEDIAQLDDERPNFYKDNACLILDLPINVLDQLSTTSMVIDSNYSYYGILTQYVPSPDDFDEDTFEIKPPTMLLLAFKLNHDGNPEPTSDLILKRKPMNEVSPSFNQLLYCGSHGIIGIRGLKVFQMKMEDIDARFEFNEIGNNDARETEMRNWGEPEYWKMMYLEERDIVVSFRQSNDLKHSMDSLFECLQFRFGSNTWTELCAFGGHVERERYMRYPWSVCYDQMADSLYFVSTEYHVVRYDLAHSEWKFMTKCGQNAQSEDIMYRGIHRKSQFIWTSDYAPNLLWSMLNDDGARDCEYIDLSQKLKNGQDCKWQSGPVEFKSICRVLQNASLFG